MRSSPTVATTAAGAAVPIIPAPRSLETRDGRCVLTGRQVRGLGRAWRTSVIRAALNDGSSGAKGVVNGIAVAVDTGLQEQHYILDIGSTGVTVTAGSAGAVGYALKTLYQYIIAAAHDEGRAGRRLMRALTGGYWIDGSAIGAIRMCGRLWRSVAGRGGVSIPNARIEDYPAVNTRGFVLDISRDRVPRMRELRALIRTLGVLKYNHLQLYVEHTFAYRGHRTVWKRASALRRRQMLRLDTLAYEQGIEMMPNQNYLGHMERWLKHDKYRGLSECPDGFDDPWGVFRPEPSTRNVSDPRTDELISDLAHQYAPLFRSGRMHIGYDEPWEFAQGVNREKAERVGEDTLFFDAVHGAGEICRQLGKKPYIWGDIALKYPQKLSALGDVGICLWGYEAGHPFEQEISTVQAGNPGKRDILLCCGTSNWNSVAGRWGNAVKNIASAVGSCVAHSLEGVVLTEWGDNGHFQQQPCMFLPVIAFAECGWQGPQEKGQGGIGTDDAVLVRWMNHYLFRDESRDLAGMLHTLAGIAERNGFGLFNATVLFCMLLGDQYPYYRSKYREFADSRYDLLRQELDALRAALSGLPRSLVRREIQWIIDALSLGAECIRHISKMETPALGSLPRDTARELAVQFGAVIRRYRALWRQRSRRGGLVDSVRRMECTRQELIAASRGQGGAAPLESADIASPAE